MKRLEELGVGRPSTYASIISTILDRGYVWKKGSALVPTFTAFAVVTLLEDHFPNLVDFAFTARMEDDLDGIAGGTEDMEPWLSRFYFGVRDQVTEDGELPEGAAGRGGLGLKELVEERLGEVLTWFGYLGGATCSDPTAGVPVPEPAREPAFRTTLSSFAPNPLVAGKTGRIRFTMAREGRASIDVFDLNGRMVRNVFEGIALEGPNEISWDGADAAGRTVASGVYFYRLATHRQALTGRMLLVK